MVEPRGVMRIERHPHAGGRPLVTQRPGDRLTHVAGPFRLGPDGCRFCCGPQNPARRCTGAPVSRAPGALDGRLPGNAKRPARRPPLPRTKDQPALINASSGQLLTVEEFAVRARLSRRQIDRLRARRPPGFPTEYDLSDKGSRYRRCPRFRLSEVDAWLDSRALW